MTFETDHIQMLSDFNELSGLFSQSDSAEAFLQKTVEVIARHMNVDVCSIFVWDPVANELVLQATRGLNPNCIGQVKLALGEGLAGKSLKELRPICEAHASKSPFFKPFPETDELKYEAFLVVPILRSTSRFGTLVVQRDKQRPFTQRDILALQATTSQLASIIENTKQFNIKPSSDRNAAFLNASSKDNFLKANIIVPGFAKAKGMVLLEKQEEKLFTELKFKKTYSLSDFETALERTISQLEDLQMRVNEQFSDVASLIFSAHVLMLKDKEFISAITSLINEGTNAPDAILSVGKQYRDSFRMSTMVLIQEKAHDVIDLLKRLLGNLVSDYEEFGGYQGHIVIAKDLLPSDLVKMASEDVSGIILVGGVTSHISILARSLQVPVFVVDTPEILNVADGSDILMDGASGNIYLNPSKKVQTHFDTHKDAKLPLDEDITSIPRETKDGTRVYLHANVNLLADLKFMAQTNADGIGLYRSEFPFLVRDHFPTEEEQYWIYSKLFENIGEKPVTMRTLDIGGDKVLSHFPIAKERNPFLGMRSIRFSLEHQDIFETQLRAMLRASYGHNAQILFPMISSIDEYTAACKILTDCSRLLTQQDIPCNQTPRLGLMIEIPSILDILDDLLPQVDFLSIGTNDLIQYLLAVDRTNEKVADLYVSYHPSVLRSVKRIVDAAKRAKKDFSLCGDMASDTKMLPFLLGIGIRNFSINPTLIPRIQAHISKLNLSDCESIAADMLRESKLSNLAKMVEAL